MMDPRDNVAVIVTLTPKRKDGGGTKRRKKQGGGGGSGGGGGGDVGGAAVYGPVVVANTHLVYNPKRGDVKLAQVSRRSLKSQHVYGNRYPIRYKNRARIP